MKTRIAVLMLLVSTSVLADASQQGCKSSGDQAKGCVSVTADAVSVPEPGTLALMGLGLAAITLVRAKKRKI